MNVYTPANYVLAPSQPATTPISITDGQTLRPQITVRRSPGAPAAPGVAFVKMINFVFDPEIVRINRGGTVTWQNLESDPHTATSEIGNEIASPSVTRQQRYVHTFNTPGVYQYRCAFHEVMQGTIIVE